MMKRLLEGLRQIADVGYLPMHIGSVDMNELLREITEGLRPKLTPGRGSLSVADLPACAGDLVQLNEVFSNLLDNAIKYLDPHRQGEIRVSGRSADGRSIYCVQDNGIGIVPEQQDRVFDMFYRVHPEAGTQGEGLGLSIVQRLVERHHGRIWLESEPGQGSRFFVALPKR
jgi:signal transduction histidine kinase